MSSMERLEKTKELAGAWCNPTKRCMYNFTKVMGIVFVWLSVMAILVTGALPGSNFWGLCIVIMAAMIGEEISKKLRLPGLLGMIVAGFLLQNVPYINVARFIAPSWSSALRSVALVIIVLRAGLGLDITVLRRMSRSVALLAFVPSTLEAVVGAVAAHFLLGMGWIWSFCLGFILCGVSPAVLIPSMLEIQEQGLGVEKGVPTLLIAGSSIENTYCIQFFSIMMSVGFATSNLTLQILQAPIEVLIASVYGAVIGLLLWYFPYRDHPDKTGYRFIILLGAGLTIVFGGNALKYPGAGPLGCLIVSFAAGYRWRTKDPAGHKAVADMYARLWRYYQPVLFGLIGAAVSLSRVDTRSLGMGIAVILIGATTRTLVTLGVAQCFALNWKERLFVAISWFPKATVQAALGSRVLDFVGNQLAASGTVERTTLRPIDYDIYEYKIPEENDMTDELLVVREVGLEILTLAVLTIVLTAPLGALAISFTSNRLLNKRRGSREFFTVNVAANTLPVLGVEELDGKVEDRGSGASSVTIVVEGEPEVTQDIVTVNGKPEGPSEV